MKTISVEWMEPGGRRVVRLRAPFNEGEMEEGEGREEAICHLRSQSLSGSAVPRKRGPRRRVPLM